MHDFQKVARAHHQVFGRADDEEKTTATSKVSTTAPTTSTSSSSSATSATTSSTTSASSTSATAKTTTSSSSSSTTSASSTTPLINLSSILDQTSSKASTTTSSTSSNPTTTAVSTTAKAAATSAITTSAVRGFTSTATLTSSGTASAASSTSSDTTTSSSSGLSGAATGGIVAACIFAGLALLIFAVRKTFIQRRKRKRNTWGAGVYPDINDKFMDGGSISDVAPPIPEKSPSSTTFLSVGAQPRTPVWAPPRPVSPNPNPYYVQPPQPSYNNAIMDAAPSLAPQGAGYAGVRPVSANSFRPQSSANEMAMVKVLYIPTLPDELSITTGEVVHVVKAYDDGWALCANARGEQGVVPLECLDRTAQTQADRLSTGFGQQESASDWRNMKRISSLSTQQPHY